MGKPQSGYKKARRHKAKDNKDQLSQDLRDLPAELDFDSCLKIYGLLNKKCDAHGTPSPKVKNCRRNPYCIHRVGNEKWEKFKRGTVDQQAPQLTRRDVEKQPCGLSNFGNFCYVNSFLQIWFNDLSFRQIIYQWRSDPDWKPSEGTKLDIQAVMNCLQELFLTMQITPYEFTNALDFISLLKLDNEQHDVQEFTILFFDALDRHLLTHPSGEPFRNAIKSRYEGVNRQIVLCSCGNRSVKEDMFMSLTLTIDGCNTLQKALDGYFTPEELSDFKCSKCGKSGGTTRANETAKLPPVLLLQLNRYTYDQYGRNKKIGSAIQYPRELYSTDLRYCTEDEEQQPIKYNLSAVMIHEGASANCGHYYDLIKDPNTDKWFIYNDKEVSQTKIPGFNPEKNATAKGTSDMKGCYGLIYRIEDESKLNIENSLSNQVPTNSKELELPAPEIVSKVETKLNDTFQRESRDGDRSYELWQKCIDEKQEALERLWVLMEVENGDVAKKKPSSIAFVPTELLSEIHAKEFKCIETMKDLSQAMGDQFAIKNGVLKPPSSSDPDIIDEAIRIVDAEQSRDLDEDELFDERLLEVTEQLVEERMTTYKRERARTASNHSISDDEVIKILYTPDKLNEVPMTLCPHGKVQVDSIHGGKVKAVNKAPLLELLAMYNIKVAASDGRTVGREGCGLLTGEDLCMECIKMLEKEYSWKESVDSSQEMLTVILARANTEAPPDACYVSKKQLQSYKKLVVQEMNYQKSLTPKETITLVFSTENSPKLAENSKILDEPLKKRRKVGSDEEDIDGIKMEKASISNSPTRIDPMDVNEQTSNEEQVEKEREDQIQEEKKENGVENEKEIQKEEENGEKEVKEEEMEVEETEEAKEMMKKEVVNSRRLEVQKENGKKLGKTSKNQKKLTKKIEKEDENEDKEQEEVDGIDENEIRDSETPENDENRPENDQNSEEIRNSRENSEEIEKKESESDENDDENNEENNDENNDDNNDDNNDEFSPPTKPEDPDDPDVEVIKEVIRAPVKQVYFNQELVCPHDEFHPNHRMTWMYKYEWDTLIVSRFAKHRFIPVHSVECQNCSTQQEEADQRRTQIQNQLTAIGNSLRKVFSNAEKRSFYETSPEYTKALCSKFIHRFRHALKAKHPVLPHICQDCLLCKEHQKPFFRSTDNHDPHLLDEVLSELSGQPTLFSLGIALPSSSTEPAPQVTGLPVTESEWECITENLQKHADIGEAREVFLEQGDYIEFCEDCNNKALEAIRTQKCTYPMGADIYVKVKQDDESSPDRTNRRGAVTRRGANKNLVRVKMRSVDTIKKLKVELYKRTSQSPADQLLYWNDNVLANEMTLFDAGIEAGNSQNPIILFTQQKTEIAEAPRPLEKGFKDTALSSA
ncbi:unnamed protein product [Bursaphelenchus xylophilus]|nr:unnamed protein product [Bursaphelenchus xylophilus]CAG9090261.1 unnamed protein product [Bursaphelenchus xylophilus]